MAQVSPDIEAFPLYILCYHRIWRISTRSCSISEQLLEDQLYLAVRLAVCQLTAPDAPILLDDALAAFDDGRMALALELLRGLGEERQILLFSCHSREAAWARAQGVPVIEL